MDGPSYREEGALLGSPITVNRDIFSLTLFYLVFDRDFLAHLGFS